MRKFPKEKIKEQGITLIALVVTIIILLILGGVTIGLATNGTGLFEKAKLATDEYNNSVDKENIELAKATNEINSYVDGNREGYNDLLSRIEKLESPEYGDFRKTSNQTSTNDSTIITIDKKENGNLTLNDNKIYLTKGKTYRIMCDFHISTASTSHVRYYIYNKNNTAISNESLVINSAYSGYCSNYAAAIYTAGENDYIYIKSHVWCASATIVGSSFSLTITEI